MAECCVDRQASTMAASSRSCVRDRKSANTLSTPGLCSARMAIVTMMSVLVYASVVRIAVWDECSQSLLLDKLCHVGMATCHCGCHVIAALSRSGFAFDVLSCSLLKLISSSIDRK